MGLSQFGLPVLCCVLWIFCGFVVFLSVSCRFPKFLWIVSVSIVGFSFSTQACNMVG